MAEFEEDPSANTARFRAFAESKEEEMPAPWQMRAPASRVILLAAGVLVVAVLAGVVALSLAG
ncbi:MAG: hypothetical protein JOY82_19945 [Streptosporangiaceae bacterium]|nr:hypothetical protein [Streptosporangiaceae bacterium]MBV9856757.1 hypothetical protein [Streptosporangiaceae bacterium]